MARACDRSRGWTGCGRWTGSFWMAIAPYIGHMDAPHGTSVVDVSDPVKPPRITATIDIPPGFAFAQGAGRQRSHAGQSGNATRGDMPLSADFVGLRVFDVSKPDSPRDIHLLALHRHRRASFHLRRFVTLTSRPSRKAMSVPIVMGSLTSTPEKPEEVGRWWMPGQWIAGGETPSWKGRNQAPSDLPRRSAVWRYWVRRRRDPRFAHVADIEDLRRRRYQ